jgi:glycosyltransferase involved in cell wall biosynthesis
MKLSVIIPCYNEEKNIPVIFSKLNVLLEDKAKEDCEVILVNNGSTDSSAHVLQAELSKTPYNIRVVNVAQNKGYGYGILQGLEAAQGEFLSWTHADLQTDPSDVFKALDIYELSPYKPILVKGFRKNRKFSELFFSWGMGLLSSIVLGTRLTEINAQPKLFKKDFYQSIKDKAPFDFSLDLYFLYQAKKHGKIVDFPVFFLPRLYGEAKGGSGSSLKVRFKLIKRTLKYIFELKTKLKT